MVARAPGTGYSPSPPPSDLNELPRYLADELQRVRVAIDAANSMRLDPTTTAPARAMPGDVVYALGAPYWDPGAGEGIYYMMQARTWAKLG